jgi:ketopantoate reductase
MSHRSCVILGTGALGGYYDASLQRAGLEVHSLLHSDYEQVIGSSCFLGSNKVEPGHIRHLDYKQITHCLEG